MGSLKLLLVALTSLLLSIVTTPLVYAETAASLEDYQAAALANSPLARQIDAKAATKLAQGIALSLGLNPELNAEFRSPVSKGNNDTEVTIIISKPLRLTQQSLREKVRELVTKASSEQQKIDFLELSQNVTSWYVKVWVLHQKAVVYQRAQKRLSYSLNKIREATAQGLFSGGEEKFFQAQKGQISAAVLEVEALQASAKAQLIRTSNLTTSTSELLPPTMPPVPSFEHILQLAQESPLSIVQRINLFTRAAEKERELAYQNARPIIAPRLVYEHADNGSDRIGLGISIPLPFYNRNQPEIIEREAEVRTAKARSNYINNDSFKSELIMLYNAAKTADAQASLYSTSVIPNLRKSLSLQEKQFERGQGSVTQLWQIQKELISAEITALEIQEQSLLARLQLWPLLGEQV